MRKITNVFCVGKNYAEHIKEFDSVAPKSPMFFMKPTHALQYLEEEKEVPVPKDEGSVHYEAELVVYLKQPYQEELPLEDMIAEVGLGIDLTLRDVQWQAKKSGSPWLAAKGFKHSGLLTQTIPFESENWFNQLHFSLERQGDLLQEAEPTQMIFSLREILRACDQHFGLDSGDIIYTGTPSGVGEVHTGDTFKLKLEGYFEQTFTIK